MSFSSKRGSVELTYLPDEILEIIFDPLGLKDRQALSFMRAQSMPGVGAARDG
jgi:hypothetical protein